MSDSDSIDLSDLRLTPKWVSDLEAPQAQRDLYRKFEGRDYSDDRRGKGRGKGRGGGGGGRGPGGGRGDAGGPHGARGRQSQGGGKGGPGRGQGQGRGRGQDRGRGGGGRDSRQQQRPAQPPIEGIDIALKPVDTGVDALAKTIKMSGRSYSVFDLGKLILGGRDRYMVTFRKKRKKDGPSSDHELILCAVDGSLWMSRTEAIRHFIDSSHFDKFYKTEKVSVDPPKGNFSVVAVCGMSGTILGPPNHHAYPSNVARLHQERFASWPLEKFKGRIRMERNDEIIQKWIETQSTKIQDRWLQDPALKVDQVSEPKPAPTPEPEAAAVTAEESTAEQTDAAVEEPGQSDSGVSQATATPGEELPEQEQEKNEAESKQEPGPEEASGPADEPGESTHEDAAGDDAGGETTAPVDTPESTPARAESETIIASRQDLERHISEHHSEELFQTVEEATVPGDIPTGELSPKLFALLRWTYDGQLRFPMQVMQELCNMLQQRGLKFFKERKKATYVARSRPRPLTNESNLSDRLRRIVSFIRNNPRCDFNILVPAIVRSQNAARSAASKPGTVSPASGDHKDPTKEPEQSAETTAEAANEATATGQPSAEGTTPETVAAAAPAPSDASPKEHVDPKPAESSDDAGAKKDGGSAQKQSKPKPEKAVRAEPTEEEIGVLKDLRWLVLEGYVTEFSNGELRLVERRDPPPSKSKPKVPAATAAAASPAAAPESAAAPVPGGKAEAVATGGATPADQAAPAEPTSSPDATPETAGAPAADPNSSVETPAAPSISATPAEPASAPGDSTEVAPAGTTTDSPVDEPAESAEPLVSTPASQPPDASLSQPPAAPAASSPATPSPVSESGSSTDSASATAATSEKSVDEQPAPSAAEITGEPSQDDAPPEPAAEPNIPAGDDAPAP